MGIMGKRLLIINVYFAPRSFGGATVIAEAMARLLARDHGWQVLILTTLFEPKLKPYAVRRYRAKGVNIVGINIPDGLTYEETYSNPAFDRVAEKIIELFQPAVIHAHSIQTMGCGFIQWAGKAGIPTVVTAHDCWWICERQFMINAQGRYCFQRKIDFRQCGYCVDDIEKAKKRQKYLHEMLQNVDLILFPSDFHKSIYIENGFNIEKCLKNTNGVSLPDKRVTIKNKGNNNYVRFGFVGGTGPVKGADLIVRALRDIESDNYELIIVDAAKIVGKTWSDAGFWKVPGKVTFVPPYTVEEMDRFYSSIDVLLFPSQWKESFGLAVREAMARDVWVIATEAGGVVEDIEPGTNGNIIPMDGDYLKLRSYMIECLNRCDWQNYVNPLKDKIRGINEQAYELSNILNELSVK
jgi:glycosyltransferase involved in cell wall biosynthesis